MIFDEERTPIVNCHQTKKLKWLITVNCHKPKQLEWLSTVKFAIHVYRSIRLYSFFFISLTKTSRARVTVSIARSCCTMYLYNMYNDIFLLPFFQFVLMINRKLKNSSAFRKTRNKTNPKRFNANDQSHL